MSWKANIALMMQKHGTLREDGARASEATQDRWKQTFNAAFNILHKDGMRVDAPWNLKEKHIEHLVKSWHANGKAIKSMKTDLYVLGIMLPRMGRPNMVKALPEYLPDVDPKSLKVSTIAKRSKSWAEAGIDLKAKIEEADRLDPRFGLMVRLMLALGLRRKEVLNCKPWKANAQKRSWQVFPGEGKSNRGRIIEIQTEQQMQVIQYVCARIGKNEAMRWPNMQDGKPMTMKQALNRYNKRMAEIGITKLESGVTGHGLRAQFAENAALIMGFVPATVGGTKGGLDKEQLDLDRISVSEALGHSRISVTSAYFGSFGRNAPVREVDFLQRSIEEGIKHMTETKTQNPLQPQYRADCLGMLDILAGFNIDITVGQVQTLWQKYSDRHGCEWVKATAEGEVERGLQVAATMHLRKEKHDDKSEELWAAENRRLKGESPNVPDAEAA